MLLILKWPFCITKIRIKKFVNHKNWFTIRSSVVMLSNLTLAANEYILPLEAVVI
jgi:hypothetical protein